MFYTKPTYLNRPLWNNAFSYRKRQMLKSWLDRLYIPSIVESFDLSKLQLWDRIAIQEIDGDELISGSSLKNFIKLSGRPIYIMDNHNHALFFWFKEIFEQKINKPIELIHIDQHSDMRIPDKSLDLQTDWKIQQNKNKVLKKIWDYTNYAVNIGNYIQPAIDVGLLSTCRQIRSFDKLKLLKDYKFDGHKVLNIDIDFWHPDMTWHDNVKVDIIKELIFKADIVTIATSPLFIDQIKAIRLVKKLLE